MSVAALVTETPEDLYARLMEARRGDSVEDTLARILASWQLGLGCLPDWLGLGETEFGRMMGYHFPDFDPGRIANPDRSTDLQRGAEIEDLHKLLFVSRTSGTESESWMVDMVVAGCLGSDHLWQDLGLWNRADLSRLMRENFAPLAERNDKDMKWKKFLYKQLCEAEGIYVCRSPSCEVCVDYPLCFGSED